jgi:hypothetical protein
MIASVPIGRSILSAVGENSGGTESRLSSFSKAEESIRQKANQNSHSTVILSLREAAGGTELLAIHSK